MAAKGNLGLGKFGKGTLGEKEIGKRGKREIGKKGNVEKRNWDIEKFGKLGNWRKKGTFGKGKKVNWKKKEIGEREKGKLEK